MWKCCDIDDNDSDLTLVIVAVETVVMVSDSRDSSDYGDDNRATVKRRLCFKHKNCNCFKSCLQVFPPRADKVGMVHQVALET